MDTFLRLRRKFGFHKVKLTYRSLGRMAMYILGFFVVLSVILSNFLKKSDENYYYLKAVQDYKAAEQELVEILQKKPDNAQLWRTLVDLRVLIEKNPIRIDAENPALISGEMSSGEFHLSQLEFINFLKTATSPDPELLLFRYRLLSDSTSMGINHHDKTQQELEEIMDIYVESRRYNKAIEVAYMILDEAPENEKAKKTIFRALTVKKNISEIQKLLTDPDWRPHASSGILWEYYLEKKQFGKMFFHLTKSQFENYTWKAYLMCGVAGLGWIILLVHIGSGWFWKRKEQLLIPAAVILGMMSAVFCLGVVVVQDFYIDHKGFGNNIFYNLAYSILGIGLREEICKLLFFLPLLYFIKGIREDYKLLCFCSLVGLGFAIEENLNYFLRYSTNPVIIGRFLTANFAHTFMTGFTCFYLVKAVQRGGRAWDEFTTTLIKMILIHGVYDFLLEDPTMKNQGTPFFAMMLYVYVALLYLRLLMNTAPPAHQYVSLTRIFTIVLCTTIGVTLMMISTEIGLKQAFKSIASGMLVYAIFAYMFYREFNEPIG